VKPTRGENSRFTEIERLRKALPTTPYAFATPKERKLYEAYREALRAGRKKPPPAEPTGAEKKP
jgi:hypothetical protein